MQRFCLVNHVTSIELHSFSDARIKAFTAVVYLRLESDINASTKLFSLQDSSRSSKAAKSTQAGGIDFFKTCLSSGKSCKPMYYYQLSVLLD